MSNESDLTLVIKAVDEASATLKSIASTSQASMGQITTATHTATAAHEGFGASLLTVGRNVIEYVAAYRLFEEATRLTSEFFKSAIEGSLEASATLAQVRVDVQNAGLSYSDLAPQIASVADQNMKYGFTVENTQLSMGKLILATGDYNDALKLNALAMDLSRAKNIDLNSATVLIQQVMAGNTRVLKQYGISLDSATTSAEALNTLQSKLKDSAAAFADTSAGKLAEFQARWREIEDQVGDQIMPIIVNLFTSFEENLPRIVADVEDFASGIAQVADFITKWSGVQFYIQQVTRAIASLADEWDLLTGRMQENANATQVLTPAMQSAIDKHNQLHSSLVITADDFKQMDIKQQTALMKQYGTTVSSAATNFDDLPNHINAANNAMLKHADAVAKLTTDYDKMQTQGATDLASLDDSFKTKMDSINKTIQTTQQNIADLTASYATSKKDEATTVAEQIVTSEQNIADLKVQLSKATTDTEKKDLQDKLNAEQRNYDSSIMFRQSHAAEITAAEARGKETDLQRTIDDYNAKQKIELDDYNKKLATLNQELKDKEDEASQERALYYSKVMAISKTLDIGQEYFKKLSAERTSVTTKEVDAEVAKFQALSAAIGQMKSASVSSLPTIALPSIPGLPSGIPHFEQGGIVPGPAGQAVPIIAHAGEQIIPTKDVGKGTSGGATFNFHFHDVVAGDEGVRNIITRTMQQINRETTLKRYAGA